MMFQAPPDAVLDAKRGALRAALRRPGLIAGGIALAFFGVGGAWSLLVPIASAAIAAGAISPEGHRRTLQHLEGGIVREIKVADGAQVEAGDVVLVLEDTQALATYGAQEGRYLTLKAMEARLHAEQAGLAPDWGGLPDLPGRADAVRDQRRIYETAEESAASQRAILDQRVKQLDERIAGLSDQIASDGRRLGLLANEIDTAADLIKRGLGRKPRLLELQRLRAEVQGQQAGKRAEVARAQQEIGETQLEILDIDAERRDEAAKQLGEIRAEMGDLEERMSASRDVLSRTVVRAPASGTVIDLHARTTGGVIRPGDPIMDIVPDEDELLVDARVSLTDIDVVEAGLTAEVKLSAYAQRNLPKLEGVVRQVAADRMTDEITGEPYYLARIEIAPDRLAALGPEVDLVPGMPADVMIFTGTRTFFDYLIGPLIDSVDKSFRES